MVDEKITEVQTLGGAHLLEMPFGSVGPICKHICSDDSSSYALNIVELVGESADVDLGKSSKILVEEIGVDNIEYVLTQFGMEKVKRAVKSPLVSRRLVSTCSSPTSDLLKNFGTFSYALCLMMCILSFLCLGKIWKLCLGNIAQTSSH